MSHRVKPAPPLDLTLVEGEWNFSVAEAGAIKRHWAQETAQSDYIFDGKVLIAPEFGYHQDGTYFARHLAVNYSAFLAWRDLFCAKEPADQPSIVNIFGSAVVVSREGYLLMGVMGPQTSNAGKIYPASGMPDLKDIDADGRMDVFKSLARELKEEMGLDAARARWGQALMIEDGWRQSVAQLLHYDQSVDDLVAEIKAHLLVAEDDELADVAVIRSVADIQPDLMPSYVPRLIRYHFTGQDD